MAKSTAPVGTEPSRTEEEKQTVAPALTAENDPVADIRERFGALAQIKRALTTEQLQVIHDTVAPSLNDHELLLFLYRANKLQLDPLAGEIFAYVAVDKDNRRQLVIIVGRDGKRVLANRTKKVEDVESTPIYRKPIYDMEEVKQGDTAVLKPTKTIVGYDRVEPWAGGELWGAEAIVKRTDREKPFKIVVPIAEYRNQKPIWQYKPETMIKKVAESQALSMAFPELLSGVYEEEEITQLESTSVDDDGTPADPGQIDVLRDLGIEVPENITKVKALQLIREQGQKKRGAK